MPGMESREPRPLPLWRLVRPLRSLRSLRLPLHGLVLVASLAQLLAAAPEPAFFPIALPSPAVTPDSGLPAGLPKGDLTNATVPFHLQAPLPLTGLQDARQGRFYPPEVRGVTIGRKFAVLHLVLGVDGSDRDGTPLVSVVVHYADGQQDRLRLAYGLQARSLVPAKDEPARLFDPNAREAALGTNRPGPRPVPQLRLYHAVLPNPRPDETVVAMDLISLFSRATPMVLAATAEGAPARTPLEDLPGHRVVRRARELDDSSYHQSLIVQARDRDGKPVSAAEATLTITDFDGAYYFGRATADPDGSIRLPVPPQHAAGFTVVVRAPGRLPFVHHHSALGLGPKALEIAAPLESGSPVGGVVRNAGGDPIPGATVTIHHLHQVSPREYNRLDYDTVSTDAAGRWHSAALPASLNGFHFAVSHPDFRPRTYRAGDRDQTGAVPVLTPEDLQANQAIALLEPAQFITGTITAAGQAVAGAEVRLSSPRAGSERDDDERIVRSDQSGRYRFAVISPGSYGLLVLAPGHAPELGGATVPNQPGSIVNLNFALRSGTRFVGKVNDQNRQPIPGARARLDTWNENRALKFEAETDEAGTFVWTNAPQGQVRFQISATNHSSTTYSFSIAGDRSENQFTLRKFSSVRGFVTDADTGKPIPEFTVVRGRAYNQGERIRWERYNTFRGRNGEYNVRLVEYSSGTRTAILVEAPDYMPASSPEFTRAGLYTNHFQLKKTRGIHGRILAPNGTPAAGAQAVLLEPSEYAYLRASGDLARNSDGGPQVRADRNGDFQFPPRLAPHTIVVTHEQGFAEVRITNALAPVTVTLQPWAQISGTVALPPIDGRPHALRVSNAQNYYPDDSRESSPLSLYLSAEAADDGSFRFPRVPPGDRRVALYRHVQIGDNTRSTESHGLTLQLAPGQTTNVVLGGGGRTVTGRMIVTRADPDDVDWRRDFHSLRLLRPPLSMNLPSPDFSKARTDEERQALWAEQRKREVAFWRTPAARDWQRGERSYVLQFATNGAFRVDGVPPGKYTLSVSPTDPSREDYSYEQIGSFATEVNVPALEPGQPAVPVDLGSFEIAIRASLRIGRKAPPFKLTLFDGKEVSLDDFRGKPVLLDFWATWSGTRSFDLRQLQTIHSRFALDKRLVMLGVNFDHSRDDAENQLKRDPLPWPQAYAGAWIQSPLRDTYGLRSVPDHILIDANGRIAGMNLRGTAITRAVERIFSGN